MKVAEFSAEVDSGGMERIADRMERRLSHHEKS